MTQTTCF